MTNQEFFDKVKDHLLTQKRKSLGKDRSCKYRGIDNLKCSIGSVIPDELYDPDMEGRLPGNLITKFPKIAELFAGVDFSLITDLQLVHDCTPALIWENELKKVACKYGLKFKV